MVTVVGMGPGAGDHVIPAAREAMIGADVIFGHERWSELVAELGRELVSIAPLQAMVSAIQSRADSESVVVLVSGDPGLFSLLPAVKAGTNGVRCEVVPGISAPQALFARLGLSWDGVTFLSLHGRETDHLTENVWPGARLCVFTDSRNHPGAIGTKLTAMGLDGRAVVGENLTTELERVIETTIGLLSVDEFASLSILYLEINDVE